MSIYTDSIAAYRQLARQIGERDAVLPAIQLSHFPIADTAIAACLLTLTIPAREPGPYTDDVDETSGSRRKFWWLGDVSPDGHKTEEILGAWQFRARFEQEHPSHPLVPMRAAIDARVFWLEVIYGSRPLPGEGSGLAYATSSLREASVLKASGFTPVAFNGRVFFLSASRPVDLTPAGAIIENAGSIEMTAPEQWMRRVLHVQDEMLKIAKSAQPIIRLREGEQTLLLTADATKKTREKFYDLL